MKKTSKTKKLAIHKDTLRQLDRHDLGQIAGGIEPTRDTPCTAPTTSICK